MPLALFGPAANVAPTPMSDDEVFGSPAAPVTPPPQAHTLAPAPMSDDEVFGGAPAAAAAGPSLWDRVSANFSKGFSESPGGALANFLDSQLSQGVQRQLREQGLGENADAYQRGVEAQNQGIDSIYSQMPSFTAAPTLGDKLKQGAASLTGQLAGAIADPLGTGLITDIPGVNQVVERVLPKAAPVAKRVIESGASQAVVNTATDPVVQVANIAAGRQQGYDPVQTALAPALGFLVGGTVHGSGEGLSALSDAFRAWRTRSRADAGVKADVPDAAPSPPEIDAFASSPEMATFLKANGITDPNDPRIVQLEDRVAHRRGQEAQAQRFQPQDAGGSKLSVFKKDEDRLAAEKSGVDVGAVDQAALSTAGRVPRQPVQEVMPVTPSGQADTGDLGIKAAMGKFGAKGGLPVPTEPQPVRATPQDVTQSQAKMFGGNQNTAEPGRMVAPEGRRPQTPEQVQQQREAGGAFTAAQAQRERAGASVHDTQPAARPEGANQQPVVLDDGFPVQVLRRSVKEVNGQKVEMATVRRYDPRTGEFDAEGMEYDTPVKQLKQSNYAVDPRQAQDFSQRAQGPGNPEQPRMADQGVRHEPDQTYRATPPDPNEEFPAAGEGRSPLPRQPEGPAPFRDRPRNEDEAMRDFNSRQQGGPSEQEARPGDSNTSSKSAPQGDDGRFPVDDRGFVNSEKGGPIKFAEQRQAAKWIINEGHKKSPDQIFEIENHPGGKGFSVRERGRAENGADQGARGAGSRPDAGARKGASPGTLPPPARPSAAAKSALDDVREARGSETVSRPQKGSLFDAIRENGGIKDDRGDVAQIMQGFKNEKFKKRVVNPNGLSPDKMRERLQEQGWFGVTEDRFGPNASETGSYRGDDIRDLYDLMDREARGKTVFHPDRQPGDRELEAERQAIRDEELSRAGITDKDTEEDAARKLTEFRASQEHDFLMREKARTIDNTVVGLSEADRENLNDEGYEPGADVGEGAEELGRPTGRAQQSKDIPGWESDTGDGNHQAEGNDRRAAEGPADSAAGVAEREAFRRAQHKQQNPRAYSGKEQQGHAEDGLFADRSEKNQHDLFKSSEDLSNKFFSNPGVDPEAWKSLGRDLGGVFGWAKDEAKAWAHHLEGVVSAMPKEGAKGEGAISRVGHALSVFAFSNDGVLRSLAAKHNSPAIRDIANLFYATPRGGRDSGAIGQTYFEALNERYGRWMNELDDLLKPLNKMGEKDRDQALTQIGRLVTNPGAIKPGTPIHDAAAGITRQLKEVLAYMREAGVQVGEIKRGYLPRVENTEQILLQPEEFKRAATKAFVADGVPAKDARQSAEDWFNRVLLGDIGVHSDNNDFLNIGGGANQNKHTNARILSKKADDILGDFYLRNPADIMPRYILKAARKAEWSRRMGDDLSKWQDYKQRIIKEGGGAALPEVVQTIKSITGNFGQAATGGGRNFLSLARTWSAFTYLSRATFASLSEPASVAIRTGNSMDLLRAYGNTVRHWMPVLRKIGDGHYLEEMARDLGIVGDAIDNISMLQRAGTDDSTLLGRRLQTNFFRQVGLTQFTESNRIAAMQGGMTFIRRLASDVTTDGHFAKMSRDLLTELGVGGGAANGRNGDPVQAFAQWVMDRDGKPHLNDILEGGDMGRVYHTALGRFVSQTVMHPTGATRPRYANHPFGSLFYNLMSFTYAFQKNVLNRVGAMTKDAVNPKSGLTAMERVRHLAPLVNLAPLLGIQYALGEIRDQIFPDPARAGQKPRSVWDKTLTAISRSGLDGIADMPLNTFTAARYQRDPFIALAGPIYGTAGQVLGDIGSYFSKDNSPNTNTVERKEARDAYDLVLKPTLIAAATAVAPAATNLGLFLGGLGIFGISHPAARERFVKEVAGPPLPPR